MNRTLSTLCLGGLLMAGSSGWGQNWQVLPDSPSSERFEDIYFVDPQQGWTVSHEGKIFKTTDGGVNWREVYNQPDYFFRSLEFLNDQIGIAGTLSGALLRTTDGGESWQEIEGQLPSSAYGICGLSHAGNNVYGVGVWARPAYFIKSTDQGATWSFLNLSEYADGLVDVHFFNEKEGIAAGIIESTGGVILKTTDGGATWKTVHNTGRGLEYVWKLDFVDDNTGFGSVASFTGNTTIIVKTTDGGDTWTNLDVDTRSTGLQTQGLGFADESLGWVAPKFTGMFETRDGGQTWQQRDDLDNVNKFFRLGGNLLYASGTYLYKYGDGSPDSTDNPDPVFEQELFEVSPNPFRDLLRITVEAKKSTYAKLDFFDVTGRLIRSLYDDALDPGTYTFELTGEDLAQLNPGQYVLLLRTHAGFRAKTLLKQ